MDFLEYIGRLQGVLTRIGDEQSENILRAGSVVANTLSGGGIVCAEPGPAGTSGS